MALSFAALLTCAKRAFEVIPEIASGHASTAAAGALLPAAVVIPPMLELLAKHHEERPEPAALSELFRKTLSRVVDQCLQSAESGSLFTEQDRALLHLWHEGLHHSAARDPSWARILAEEIPAATVRLISLDVRQPSTYWPFLRALLARWTDWFRYLESASGHSGTLALGISVPSAPLHLSPEFEKYLAYNFPAVLRAEFHADLTSGREETAFRQSLIAILEKAGRDLAPLDPLKPISEFPNERDITRDVQILNAAYRALPYIGRANDLEFLWDWLHEPAPVSFQVVCGRGGSGKTRLAYRFLETIEERAPFAGWHAGVLESQRIKDALRNEKFRRWRRRQPTLIVIDYAAAWTEQLAGGVIRELRSSSPASDPDAPPLRFLLLERGADDQRGWYNTLLREAGDRREEFFPHAPLQLSPLDSDQRVELFQEALGSLRRFEKRTGKPPRAQTGEPPRALLQLPANLAARMETRKIDDPLLLAMAAMVAHGRGNLDALDLDRIDLARQVANHEYRRLEDLARAAGSRPFLLLHLAACVTLAGGLNANELAAACRREKERIESDWTLPELLDCLENRALPARDGASGAGNAAEPIVPDIVGEAFVLEVFRQPGHEAEETIARVAAGKLRPAIRALVRLIQDFAPDPANPRREDEEDQKRALEWLIHLLRHTLGTQAGGLRDEDFWEIHAALPLDTIAMLGPAHDFYRAVAESRELVQRDPVAIEAIERYGVFSGSLGHRRVALEAMAKVVPLRRGLAEADPDAFLPALARSLNNQSKMQSEMGQRAEALDSIAEAVTIYRRLAGTNPDAFLPALATSLNNRSNGQSEMGQRADALASIAEAVTIRRKLAGTNPDAFLPALATSLNNQSAMQSGMGQRAEALASIAEAVTIYRRLAGTNPDAFLPGLTVSLNNQSSRQSEMGQRAEALASIADAVTIRRKLAEVNPDAFLPALASSLNNQSNRQSGMGQRAEALASIADAVTIYRKLAGTNPDAFLPDLASSLNNQSNSQSEMGQRAEALASIAEAVTIYRRLAGINPDAFLPDLAMSLNNQSNTQSGMGRRAEALASIGEAVFLYRRLAEVNPDAFLPNLARSYGSWGRILIEHGNSAEAAEKFGEGLRLITPLAIKLPQAHLRLARALAEGYAQVCGTAGVPQDPDLTSLIERLAG